MSRETADIGTAQQNPTAELKREFKIFEIASFAIQVVLAIIGIGAVCIYNRQLKVMQGTLDEMKRSGVTSTQQTEDIKNALQGMERSFTKSVTDEPQRFREAVQAERERDAINRKANKENLAESDRREIAQNELNRDALAKAQHDAVRPQLGVRYSMAVNPYIPPVPRTIPFNIVPYNNGDSAAQNVTVAGLACATGDEGWAMFFGTEIKMPARNENKIGVTIPKGSTGSPISISCTAADPTKKSRVTVDSGIELVLYGRLYYSDTIKNDTHWIDFCVGGTPIAFRKGEYRQCQHNNGSN